MDMRLPNGALKAPVLCAFAAAAALTPGFAWAQASADSGDTAWVLTATALVLLMTLPGLALFYAGLVRANNVLSVMAHCLAVACLMSLLWLAAAYSLAFGEGSSLI